MTEKRNKEVENMITVQPVKSLSFMDNQMAKKTSLKTIKVWERRKQ